MCYNRATKANLHFHLKCCFVFGTCIFFCFSKQKWTIFLLPHSAKSRNTLKYNSRLDLQKIRVLVKYSFSSASIMFTRAFSQLPSFFHHQYSFHTPHHITTFFFFYNYYVAVFSLAHTRVLYFCPNGMTHIQQHLYNFPIYLNN